MTTTNQDFTMWSGDSKVLEVTVTKADGSAVILTGASVAYVMRDGADISKSVGDGISSPTAGGLFEIALDPSDTTGLAGDYHHECEVTDSSENVSTVFVGTVTINADLIES